MNFIPIYFMQLYDKWFYIRKLLEDCGNDLLKIKFLNQRGVQEFKWPACDDIETARQSTIFCPIQLSITDPFIVSCLKDIQESYKELQSIYKKNLVAKPKSSVQNNLKETTKVPSNPQTLPNNN